MYTKSKPKNNPYLMILWATTEIKKIKVFQYLTKIKYPIS